MPIAFEVHGTQGVLNWNFEKMSEMNIFLPDGNKGHDGFVTLYTGPDHPYHANFDPGPATSLSYDDLKVIEAHNSLRAVGQRKQGEPGFEDALRVAEVREGVIRSWVSGGWEKKVRPIDY